MPVACVADVLLLYSVQWSSICLYQFLLLSSSVVTFGNITKRNECIFITQIKSEMCACQKPVYTNGPLNVFKETIGAFS